MAKHLCAQCEEGAWSEPLPWSPLCKIHLPKRPRLPSVLYALEPSSRALGKGMEIEETHADTDQHTDFPALMPKVLFNLHHGGLTTLQSIANR